MKGELRVFTGIHLNGTTSVTVSITFDQVSQIFQDREVCSKFKAMPGKSFLEDLAELVTFLQREPEIILAREEFSARRLGLFPKNLGTLLYMLLCM